MPSSVNITQVDLQAVNSAIKLNEYLREYSKLYPKRKIIGVSMVPNEHSWYATITYEVIL